MSLSLLPPVLSPDCPWICPCGVVEVQEKPQPMRALMPATAELVDWLRQLLGREKADARIKSAMAGKGGFWVQETGPDGVVREFGSRCEATSKKIPGVGV